MITGVIVMHCDERGHETGVMEHSDESGLSSL